MAESSFTIKRYLPHSLVLHGVAIGLMVLLWKDPTHSGVRKVNEVAPQKKMAEQVREIRKMRDEMVAEAKKREQEQAKAVQKVQEEELPKTEKLLAEIEKTQKEVQAKLEKAATLVPKDSKEEALVSEAEGKKGKSGESTPGGGSDSLASLVEDQKKIDADQLAAMKVIGGGGKQFEPAKKALDEATKLQKAAAAALGEGQKSASPLAEQEKSVTAANAEKTRAETALNEALDRLEKLKAGGGDPSDIERQERAINQNLKPDVADANTALTAALQTLETARTDMVAVASKALEAQKKASLAQAEATKAFRGAMSAGVTKAVPESKFPPLALSPESQPETAAEAVEVARRLEKEAEEVRRRQRAAELAMIQKIPIEEAYKALAPEAGSATATSEKNVTTTEQAAKAVAEIAGRVSDMHHAAAGRAHSETYLDWVKALDAADAPASELVKSGKPGTAVDLVAAMENRGKGQGGDHAGPGSGDSNFVRTSEDGSSKPPVLTSSQVRTVPGRTVGSDGVGADWMTVDTWHLVGPFANAGRVNRNLRFPPEERVDLDATYPGADGKPLKWEFIQSTKPALKPMQKSESVFYAYTEVWFEEAQNLWVAIGCDDNAKVWIEDQLIYRSDDQNKGWDFAEALRRISFKKGLNRILYRIENGPNVVAYSLAIHLRNSDPLTTTKR